MGGPALKAIKGSKATKYFPTVIPNKIRAGGNRERLPGPPIFVAGLKGRRRRRAPGQARIWDGDFAVGRRGRVFRQVAWPKAQRPGGGQENHDTTQNQGPRDFGHKRGGTEPGGARIGKGVGRKRGGSKGENYLNGKLSEGPSCRQGPGGGRNVV